MGELRLPQGALVDRIELGSGLVDRPFVKIPFSDYPQKEQVKTIADTLAKFVSMHLGELQEVKDISITDPFNIQYVVQANVDTGRSIHPNYRIFKSDFSGVKGVKSTIYIFTDASCSYDPKTLEAFVKEVKNQ